eukprot:820233-Rhodomonas_salina.3
MSFKAAITARAMSWWAAILFLAKVGHLHWKYPLVGKVQATSCIHFCCSQIVQAQILLEH